MPCRYAYFALGAKLTTLSALVSVPFVRRYVDGTLVVGGVFLTSFFLEGGSILYSAAGSDSVVFKLLP